MAVVGSLVVNVIGNTLPLQASLAAANAEMRTFSGAASNHGNVIGNTFRAIGTAALAGGAIFGGVAIASIRAAADFQEQMAIINTIAHKTPAELDVIGHSIRQLAIESGTALPDLTKGFYDLLSAGIPASKAMADLRLANTLAIGGLATTTQTVDLLTTAINAYGLNTHGARLATDQFARAVADGKVTADQIAATFSDIAPIARSSGIGIDEISASYAFLTARGVTAGSAMTQMQRAILELIKPSTDLTNLQEKLGINFAEVADKKGLVVALQEVRDAAEANDVPLTKIFGRVEGLNFVLATTGGHAGAFAKELARMTPDDHAITQLEAFRAAHARALGGGGGGGPTDVTGEAGRQAAERADTVSRNFDRLKAIVNDIGITIGDRLLPTMNVWLHSIGQWLNTHSDDLANFFMKGVDFGHRVVTIIGNVIGEFNKLPPWLKEALIGGVIADRIFKVALGFDPVVAGAKIATSILGGIGGKILDLARPMPVFVTNPGFGGGVGPGGGGGAGGGFLAGAGKVAGLGLAVTGGALLGETIGRLPYDASVQPALKYETSQFDAFTSRNATDPGKLQQGIDIINSQIHAIAGNTVDPLERWLMPELSTLEQQREHLNQLLVKAEAGNQKSSAFASSATNAWSRQQQQGYAQHTATVHGNTTLGHINSHTASMASSLAGMKGPLGRATPTGQFVPANLGGTPSHLAPTLTAAGVPRRSYPTFQHGGMVPGIGEQLIIAHGGETVLPRGGGGGQPSVVTRIIQLVVDGRVLAEAVDREMFGAASGFSSGFAANNPIIAS